MIAVDDVDLEIGEGEFVVLVGPSGCGKSTLLRMIAGLEDVTDGDDLDRRADVTDKPPQQRDIAMVFQNYALYPHMTVSENLGLRPEAAQDCRRREWQRRVDETAKTLGLESCSTASRRRSRAASGNASRWAARSCVSRRRS